MQHQKRDQNNDDTTGAHRDVRCCKGVGDESKRQIIRRRPLETICQHIPGPLTGVYPTAIATIVVVVR